jgi:hypothetical protein
MISFSSEMAAHACMRSGAIKVDRLTRISTDSSVLNLSLDFFSLLFFAWGWLLV